MIQGHYPYVHDMRIGDVRWQFEVNSEFYGSWSGLIRRTTAKWDGASIIKPGMVIVDAGGHHGVMACALASKTGPQGRVHCYELLPGNAEIIRRNVALNNFSNVTVRPVRFSDTNRQWKARSNGEDGMVVSEAEAGDQVVELVRLDDDLPSDVIVNFLKMDVEGSELQALLGSARILKNRPFINLEVHNLDFADRGTTWQGLSQILEPLRLFLGVSKRT